jgi:predicted membrane-bound mannosyltransferase
MTVKNMLVLQSCADAPRVEHGLCSTSSARSSDDSNKVISISTQREEIHIKEEVEPIAMSSSSVKDEREVSPQTFHQYLGLPSVFMPFICLPFHIN